MIRKIKNWFSKKSEYVKTLIVILTVDVIGFLVLSFCFFVGYSNIPLGWLLGSVGSLINYILLYLSADAILKIGQSKQIKAKYFIDFFVRIFVIVIILTIPLVLDYFEYKIFSIWSTFASLLIVRYVIMFLGNFTKDA